jgi:hypothetical protein
MKAGMNEREAQRNFYGIYFHHNSIITWAAELMWQLPVFENYPGPVDQSVCLFKTAAMHLLVRSLLPNLPYC